MSNFKNLSSEKKEKINEFFSKWFSFVSWSSNDFKFTKSNIVFNNYKKDHFLEKRSFDNITDFIIKNSYKSTEEILIELRDYIRENHHFKGGKLKVTPIILGSVFIKKYLTRFLCKEYPNLFFDLDYLELFMAKDPKDYDDDDEKCYLKTIDKHIWLTWNEKYKMLSPFSFAKGKRESILNALGLGDVYFKEINETILVTFEIESSQHLKRPSIADANFDNDLWRPTKPDFHKHGLTKSITPLKLGSVFSSKRPETVANSKNLNMQHLFKKIDNHE